MMDYANRVRRIRNELVGILSEYESACDIVKKEQGVMQDIAHKLELYRTSDKERQKLATIYANSARKRRKHKDCKELLEVVERIENEIFLISRFDAMIEEIDNKKLKQEKRQYAPRSTKIRFDDVEKFIDMRVTDEK